MKKYLLIIATLAVSSLMLLGGRAAATGPFDDICRTTPTASVCVASKKPQDPNGKNSLYGPGSLLAKATSLAALAVGVVSVIMIIVGGIKFVLSSGDSNNIASARNTVIYAVVGVILAAFAASIVVFVINKL